MRISGGARLILFTAQFGIVGCDLAQAARFVAYSMSEAQRRLDANAAGRSDRELKELGGITRVLGMVYDAPSKDLILFGQTVPGRPKLSLDDFVVALRSRFLYKGWPEVSIENTPELLKTGRQAVRFEAGIADTAFGNDLLEADVILKKLSLGILASDIWGVRSYWAMALERHQQNPERRSTFDTRFWFYPKDIDYAHRQGIVVIRDFKAGVRTQLLRAAVDGQAVSDLSKIRNEVAEAFANGINASYEDLAAYYAPVARVGSLLNLVAVARGMELLPSGLPIEYWLKEYQVAHVSSPREHQLLKREQEIAGAGHAFEVSGGVRLEVYLSRINEDGDITAIRDVILKTRSSGNALTWPLPLEGWQLQGTGETESVRPSASGGAAAQREVGMSLSEGIRSVWGPQTALEPARGAVGMPGLTSPPDVRIDNRLPAYRNSHNVGGVLLGGTARVPGAPEASVDLSRGNFSLIVEGQGARLAPETFRKFITALWAVYYSPQDPGISIDPIAPGVNKHLVRYIGRVINTDLGRVMRESDYAMKKWAVGTERPDVAGFEDVDRLTARHGLHYVGAQRRFWFVPEDMTFRRGGDALLFAGGRMTVKTEYVFQNKTAQAEPADERFAEFFTRHYQEIAKRYPFYQELFEYAKLVSLAKYLKESGVPLFWFLMANKDLVLTEDSPGTVDALARGSRYFEGLTIEGGVDLRTEGKYVYDEQALSAIQAARAKLPASAGSHDATAVVAKPSEASPERLSFTLGKESYSVLPQHSLTSGKDRWGIRYQTDFGLHGKSLPGLEMVRYYDSRRPDSGEFGKGWRLLIPYRVKPVGSQRREFLNVEIPERMAVENLVTGEQEVLTFSTDRYSVAGYVPDKLASSQVVGLFLMSDASFRLADKLGNEFWFDPAGDLTEMVFGKEQRMHIEYARGFTSAFAQTPYRLEPTGEERIDFAGARIPARMKVVDLASGASETLAFSDKGRIAGYAPADEKQSRFRILALLSDASFRLLDRAGNETSFDSSGKFENMVISPESRMVESISGGGYKVTFAYGTDRSGNVRIASGSLTEDTQGAEPARVAYYHYDEEGRLAQVTGRESGAPAGPPVGAP